MHASRPGPEFSINIPKRSPVLQLAFPAFGTMPLIYNMKIYMISKRYGMTYWM